jgi:hypothetical protein
MPAVIGIFVDVDDDEPGDWEAGDSGDKFDAALGAAAVPVQFRLADAPAFEGFAQFSGIVVIAQRRSKQVCAGIKIGPRSGLVSPGG